MPPAMEDYAVFETVLGMLLPPGRDRTLGREHQVTNSASGNAYNELGSVRPASF